jgi:hypothetical protein
MKPSLHYTARHFLEDEQQLLAGTEQAESPLRCLDRPDGRLLPLPTDPLRQAMTTRGEAARCFSVKYGAERGTERERRFRLVLDYVDTHRDELMEAGLASEGEPLAVREEFLDYLLRCRVDSTLRTIPSSALTQFLDEWGHRWI